MLGVELGVRLLVYTKNLGLSGVVLLAASVVVMFGLFIYTQIETQKSHKKMDSGPEGRQGSRPRGEGQQAAPLLPEHPPHAHHQLPHGAPGHLHVGHRDRRHVHRHPGRLPRGGRRLHPRAGPGLRRRRDQPHRGRHRPGRDRRLRRLRRAAPVHGGQRRLHGGVLHDHRRHDRRPVRQHRDLVRARPGHPLHPELLAGPGHRWAPPCG